MSWSCEVSWKKKSSKELMKISLGIQTWNKSSVTCAAVLEEAQQHPKFSVYEVVVRDIYIPWSMDYS